MSKRNEYVAKMKAQLDDWNRDIGQLEAKTKAAGGEAEKKYREQLDALREQSRALSAKVDDVKAAGEDQWEKLVDEVTRLSDAVKHSFNYFKSQL